VRTLGHGGSLSPLLAGHGAIAVEAGLFEADAEGLEPILFS